MGISITATNSQYEFFMGYSGFFNLRKNVALALDKEFGEHYASLPRCFTEESYKSHDDTSKEIIKKNRLDSENEDILNFLYLPDVEGKVSYKTCKKIADLLEPRLESLKGNHFQYESYQGDDYHNFVAFLRECYKNRRNMRWE